MANLKNLFGWIIGEKKSQQSAPATKPAPTAKKAEAKKPATKPAVKKPASSTTKKTATKKK